ncbi:MAG: branched-chain amino acid ABC transporter permease [Promethearchaeota archaeon]|nr:MAG: branched-chain amino acid ABC transporter permease [Candidatus Lokiarchaeota archaeon]
MMETKINTDIEEDLNKKKRRGMTRAQRQRLLNIIIPLVIVVVVFIVFSLTYTFFQIPTGFPQILIFGSTHGAIVSLLAIGLSLVYGVGGVMNLAHGGFYLMAGYIFYWTVVTYSLNFFLGIIISIISVTLIGGASYLLLIKPLMDSPIGVLMVTFAIAYFFQAFILLIVQVSHPLLMDPLIPGSIEILGVSFGAQNILIIVLSLATVLGVSLFINKTKLGKSIRAVAQDREAAMLAGINADRILMYVVMISAFLAGLAAILNVPKEYISPYVGWGILTESFAVVVLGGLGNLLGSVVGSFILGYAISICNYLIDPSFASLIPGIVIVITLILRPQGLFGKEEIY